MIATEVAIEDLPERYAFLDPAGRRQPVARVQGCRPAISVVAVDALGRIFWLYAWAKKVSTRELVHHIFAVNEYWRPHIFGCEANALQSLFADAVELLAEARGKSLPLMAVRQPTHVDKDFRIQCALHPLVGEGRLLVLEQDRGMPELVGVPKDCLDEMVAFPMHPMKDVIDSLASVCTLVPPRRVQAVRRSRAAFRRYEREMGELYGGGADVEEDSRVPMDSGWLRS